MRDKFFAGIKTTSLSEGVKSFIQNYIHCKNSLFDFIHNFERVVKEYRHNELHSDFKTMDAEPVLTTPLPHIEGAFSKHLTRKMFREVKNEIEDVGGLNVSERSEVGDVI